MLSLTHKRTHQTDALCFVLMLRSNGETRFQICFCDLSLIVVRPSFNPAMATDGFRHDDVKPSTGVSLAVQAATTTAFVPISLAVEDRKRSQNTEDFLFIGHH